MKNAGGGIYVAVAVGRGQNIDLPVVFTEKKGRYSCA